MTRTDHPLGWLLTVVQKEHANKQVMRTALVEAMSHINPLGDAQAQQRQRAISYMLLLILHRRPAEEHEELSTLVDQHIEQPLDREEVGVMAQTMAEHLIERGKAQGCKVSNKVRHKRNRRRFSNCCDSDLSPSLNL